MPYFEGFLAAEPGALIESFAGEPIVFDPVRGRIKGVPAFTAFVAHTHEWLVQRSVRVEALRHVIFDGGCFEEVVLHVDRAAGQVALPFAIITDRQADERIDEVRVYRSTQPLMGPHSTRAPLMQPDPGIHIPDVVAEHQRALAAGDVDAILATFEHAGEEALPSFYERMLANGWGVGQEHCAIVGDGRTYALEYNVVRLGSANVPPQAGVAVFVLGESGKLSAVRVYDDIDPTRIYASSVA